MADRGLGYAERLDHLARCASLSLAPMRLSSRSLVGCLLLTRRFKSGGSTWFRGAARELESVAGGEPEAPVV